jgi:hypothetical protein
MEACNNIKELTLSYSSQEDENEKFNILVFFFHQFISFIFKKLVIFLISQKNILIKLFSTTRYKTMLKYFGSNMPSKYIQSIYTFYFYQSLLLLL